MNQHLTAFTILADAASHPEGFICVIGIILIIVAVTGGGHKAGEYDVPRIGWFGRIFFFIFGLILCYAGAVGHHN